MRKSRERNAAVNVRGGGAKARAALAALLILAWGSLPPAQVSGEGTGPPVSDFLATWLEPKLPELNSIQFGSPDVQPIPADFFGPGSDPFVGLVPFDGIPLDPGITGNASVQMRRSGDPVLPADPPGSVATIPIELVSLELRSIAPITVTFGAGAPELWDLDITLSPAPVPPGTLTATKTHDNGGTFTAEFNVQPLFIFTKVADPLDIRIIDTGEFGIRPNHLVIPNGQFVHQVNPNLDLILPEFSDWVPGVQETVPGDVNSQVAVPFTANSDGGGVTHTVCPANPKEGRCAVSSNTIPANQTACTTTTNGDGTKNVKVTFNMNARFRDNCSCCEYRQDIKGEFKWKGRKLNHPLAPGVNMDKNTFHEDCLRNPPAGTNVYYGHRSEPANTIPSTGDAYTNRNNRATGCNYAGVDSPGMSKLQAGRAFSFSLNFQGKIIDTCNGTDVRTHLWKVNCSGTAVGPPPDPLVEILIETTINGRDAILGIYRYPGDILTVVASILNGNGLVSIDASEVNIKVAGLVAIDTPAPGPLLETRLRSAAAQAVYDFDYPPGSPQAIEVAFTFGPETQVFDVVVPPTCPTDINGDGATNVLDLVDLLLCFGQPAVPGCEDEDVNGDGTVNVLDLIDLLLAFGTVCP